MHVCASCPWMSGNSPGNPTGVGSRPLLQGIFPTQGLNLGLLHCRPTIYHLSHQGTVLPLSQALAEPRDFDFSFMISSEFIEWKKKKWFVLKQLYFGDRRISSVQSLSRVQLFATPWTAAHQASLSITICSFTQFHVHRIGDAIQPSQPLSSPPPFAFSLSQHQALFQSCWLFTSGGSSIGASTSS